MVEEKKTINIGVLFEKLKETLKESKKLIHDRDNTTRQLQGTKGKSKQSDQQYKDFTKNQKQIKKNQAKIDKKLKEQDKILDEVKNGILNPFSARKNKILGKIIHAAIILEVVNLIIERLQKEFGLGGRWDLRKLVKVAVLEYLPSIKSRIARNRGEVYFSSGHGSTVYQGAPGISNTERKSDGHLRDVLIDPWR
ncbi:MAG: hypothetical protein HRU07_06635 [Nitrosopumilus sp.]|nr:hypothetical protein [Nitrosopumilus sp.]NRA05817.1 hypothetical protein [Nitrosopumilus sp.]